MKKKTTQNKKSVLLKDCLNSRIGKTFTLKELQDLLNSTKIKALVS